MSAHRTYVARIQCDAPGCTEEREEAETAKGIRVFLCEYGWRCDKTGDWCPKHRAVTGEATFAATKCDCPCHTGGAKHMVACGCESAVTGEAT